MNGLRTCVSFLIFRHSVILTKYLGVIFPGKGIALIMVSTKADQSDTIFVFPTSSLDSQN